MGQLLHFELYFHLGVTPKVVESVAMDRAQNYGITVLHPEENSADSAADDSDIIFEYAVPDHASVWE